MLFLPSLPSRTGWRLAILQRMVTIILCFWLVILIHIPLYNTGGAEGVCLPWNILAWAVAVIIITVTTVMAPGGRPNITPVSMLLFSSVLLLTLPLLWCPVWEWAIYSLPRLSGLWGAAIFYFALLQCRFSQRIRRLFLWFVTLASLIQGGYVMAGLFCPALLSPINQMFLKTGGRESLGIFQQVNVTASFVATGFALSLALFYRIGRMCVSWEKGISSSFLTRVKSLYLLVTMVFLTCVLVLTRSRTGWLGGMTVYIVAAIVLFMTVIRRRRWTRNLPSGYVVAMVAAPLAGVVAGLILMDCSVLQAIEHTDSNYQRWLTLKVTLEMIRLHPLAGWGLGSFTMQFQHYIASHYFPNPTHGFMGHPHNEILYVWMEGGILALTGLIAMGYAVVMLFWENRSPARMLMAMAMLPVLLHTMFEYPLYLSVPHALMLLLITLNLDRPQWRAKTLTAVVNRTTVVTRAEICVRGTVTAICVWLLICLHSAYQVNAMLGRFEAGKKGFPQNFSRTDVPWLLTSRYEADRMNLMLEAYDRNGDLRLLRDAVKENACWLKTHTDPDNYASEVEVLRYLYRNEEACRYLQEWQSIFPHDERLKDQTCR